MTSEEKFDEVIELLKEEYDSNSLTVNEIIEMVMDDVFKDYPTDHLGTLVAEIRDALNKNKELFGERFCPCVPSYKYCTQNAKDYICPCKDFRENVKEGDTCHCGLFIK